MRREDGPPPSGAPGDHAPDRVAPTGGQLAQEPERDVSLHRRSRNRPAPQRFARARAPTGHAYIGSRSAGFVDGTGQPLPRSEGTEHALSQSRSAGPLVAGWLRATVFPGIFLLTYKSRRQNIPSAKPNFRPTGRSEGETNPSMVPATISIGIIPSTRRTERPASRTSEAPRGSVPGKSNPLASSSPPPPAMKIAGNSITPCGATKPHNCSDIPDCQQAAPTTPRSSPLNISMAMVPMPAVIPRANVLNDTLRLFVMMALDASGFTDTIECVHICRFSIVSIMWGPSR